MRPRLPWFWRRESVLFALKVGLLLLAVFGAAYLLHLILMGALQAAWR